ncbi:MAG: hypothetical protein IPH88_08585 [Bacteroidales bacterium]|nr:hypothetical protein [Bacteroidales bacterium]
MMKLFSHSLLSIALFLSVLSQAQTSMPAKVFREDAQTHNMHIASDGKFLYTCNGGVPDKGQISKFSLSGEKIASYPMELDMRSIVFNNADGKLYVSTYDKQIYRINDLMMGNCKAVFSFEDRDGQSVPGIDPKGKYFYFYENGDVYLYAAKNGKLKKKISGLGDTPGSPLENSTIAVDKNYMYTWSPDEQKVFAYTLKGKFVKSFKLNQGNYSFSLSAANDMIWVSIDGNYDTGTWYGYSLF